MCIGDWRINRLIKHQIRSFTTLLTTPVTIPASMQRVAVNVAVTPTIPVGVQNVVIAIDGVNVFTLDAAIQFVHYDQLGYGDLSFSAFKLTGSTDGIVVSVIEWFLPESVLQSALKSLESEYKL